jgi:hypothetical protein
MPPLLAPIDSSLVGYTAIGSDFTGLVAAALGNTGDVSDGWDTDIEAILQTFPATDAALADLDSGADAIDSALSDFSALDTASAIGDLIAAPPTLLLEIRGPVLNPVGGPSLPAPPTAPTPPPTVCVPTAPSVTVRPPETGHRPPGPPISKTPPCPDGQYFSPTLQNCTPINSPPPPAPDPPGGNPLPLPVPPISPCPSGFVYDPNVQDCVPAPSGGGTPGFSYIGGVLMPSTGEQAAASLASVLSVTLGLPLWLIQAIPIFGTVVSAFLTFNELFGGNFDQEMAAYAAEMRVWAASAPVAFQAYATQLKIQNLQASLADQSMPRQVRASVEQQLADAQTEYRALETCAAAGQFNSCPPYV